MKSKTEKLKECPECGSDNIVYKRKEDQLACQECGAIFEELSPDDEKDFENASEVM